MDDIGVLQFVRQQHEDWNEWLKGARLSSVGKDPSRHTAATLRRFWASENPVPKQAFSKSDETLAREIAGLSVMRDDFVEFLKTV